MCHMKLDGVQVGWLGPSCHNGVVSLNIHWQYHASHQQFLIGVHIGKRLYYETHIPKAMRGLGRMWLVQQLACKVGVVRR